MTHKTKGDALRLSPEYSVGQIDVVLLALPSGLGFVLCRAIISNECGTCISKLWWLKPIRSIILVPEFKRSDLVVGKLDKGQMNADIAMSPRWPQLFASV